MGGRRAGTPLGPTVAVVAGSGMERLFTARGPTIVATRYGPASVYRFSVRGEDFLFVPRHGAGHELPPHRVNFQANVLALKDLGVRSIIATSAVGSISGKLAPGEMGLVDQFIDLSKRHVTFFDERPEHVDMTHPYDTALQKVLLSAAEVLGERLARGLVYVSVDGPRYETAAEIRMFGIMGGDVVGMTGAPEAILANELGLRYASIVVATNLAAGLQEKVSHSDVVEAMASISPRLRRVIEEALSGNRL